MNLRSRVVDRLEAGIIANDLAEHHRWNLPAGTTVSSGLDDSQLLGDAAGFDGILYLELAQDFLPVSADGIDTDGEQSGNVLACLTFVNQPQHLFFSFRQDPGIVLLFQFDGLTVYGIYNQALGQVE